MKNKFYHKILFIGFFAAMFTSCNKDKFTPVDMDELNPDIPLTNSALDQWLKVNFLDVYDLKEIRPIICRIMTIKLYCYIFAWLKTKLG